MIRSSLSCLILVLFAVPVAWPADREKSEPKPTEDEAELLKLINKEREAKELPPLRLNPTLLKVARAHSANMARQEKMEHVLDGKNPSQRVLAAGYDYRYIGENIAVSDGAPLADILKGWMNSRHHRDNILNKNFRETGLAIARNKKGDYYYTQVFGTPLPPE